MSDTETDSDNDFLLQDIQALKRACSLTGLKTDDVIPKSSSLDDNDIFGDMELLRDIKKRFSVPKKKDEEEVVMKPLNTILPDEGDNIDDDEDYGGDIETLRAIQR
nr:myb domain protein 4r1 [Tanacetum cinerariifolium]